jgi:hypothetical protein
MADDMVELLREEKKLPRTRFITHSDGHFGAPSSSSRRVIHLPGESLCRRLKMYAMISALCSDVSLNIGIPACGVVSATVKAALVIPGAVARSKNVGARAFGDQTCCLWVA